MSIQSDQIFLDPVTTEIGVLLLDVLGGLVEVEPFSTRPDKFALLGSSCTFSIRSQRASASSTNCSPLGECLHSRRSSRKGSLAKILSSVSSKGFRGSLSPSAHDIVLHSDVEVRSVKCLSRFRPAVSAHAHSCCRHRRWSDCRLRFPEGIATGAAF